MFLAKLTSFVFFFIGDTQFRGALALHLGSTRHDLIGRTSAGDSELCRHGATCPLKGAGNGGFSPGAYAGACLVSRVCRASVGSGQTGAGALKRW